MQTAKRKIYYSGRREKLFVLCCNQHEHGSPFNTMVVSQIIINIIGYPFYEGREEEALLLFFRHTVKNLYLIPAISLTAFKFGILKCVPSKIQHKKKDI